MAHAIPWLIIAALLLYTGALMALSARAKRRLADAGGENFLHGGRTFGFRHVFILVTVLWASSIFIVELETGFLSGISAVWFGVSVIVMSVLVAAFLLKPFQRIGYLTNSRMIGERYGRAAQRFSATVIALTFPIFAMSNVLAAAEFIHALVGWSLPVTLTLTTAIMLVYVGQSGMWSLAYTQTLNLITLTAGIAVAAWFLLRAPATVLHPVHIAGFHSWTGVGTGTLAVWMLMNILNSLSAQAELQAIAAVKNPRRGQAAVYVSALVLIAFTIIPVWLGMRTREMFPLAAKGLAAFPAAVAHVAPPWALLVVALGVWASALAWCAPLLFSGASSFGADLFLRPAASGRRADVRTLTRYGLIVQGVLVVIVSLLRPDELAWWRVFGQTIRSGAIFAPTAAYFLWPLATRRGAIWSMTTGVMSSLIWNAVTGFSATRFLLAINPMWVGLTVSALALVVVSLAEHGFARSFRFPSPSGYASFVFAATIALTAALTWWIAPALHGALICVGVLFTLAGVALSSTPAKKEQSSTETGQTPVNPTPGAVQAG